MRFDAKVRTNGDMASVCSLSSFQFARLSQFSQAGNPSARHLLLWLIALASISGCASVATTEPNGSLVRHYLGYVKVAIPQAAGRGAVYISDVSAVGLRIASGHDGGIWSGIGVGYSRDRQVVVPLDCRVALLVANQAQLDDAVARLTPYISNGSLCAAVSPSLDTTPPGDKP
jgi:hypothetical protein